MYSGDDIGAAARRQMDLARDRVRVPLGRNGVCSMRIDPVLYHNAVQSNRKVYGVRDIWSEKEFRDDMARRHPELATVTDFGREGRGRAVAEEGSGRMTRLGRATFSKVYG